MNLNLDNKIIIVTGGAKGIGEGIVKALAAENAIPVIVGRKEADNLKTLEIIKAETKPGEGGEHDVAGLYAHVMLQAWKLTKQKNRNK